MPALINDFRIYRRYLTVFFRSSSEFRTNWVVTMVKAPFVLALQFFVWSYFFHQQGATIGGLTFSAFFMYFAVQQTLNILQCYPVSNTIARDIQTGQLSIYLARPVSYLPVIFTQALGQWLLGFVSLLIPATLIIAAGWGGQSLTMGMVVAFLCSLSLAGLNFFLLETLIGLSAFRFFKILGVKLALTLLFDIFGGRLLPLTLLPRWMQDLSYLIPTRAIYYEPARILIYGPSREGVGLQLLMVAVLGLAVVVQWRRGFRIYDGAL